MIIGTMFDARATDLGLGRDAELRRPIGGWRDKIESDLRKLINAQRSLYSTPRTSFSF
jgi:hypothetical protein